METLNIDVREIKKNDIYMIGHQKDHKAIEVNFDGLTHEKSYKLLLMHENTKHEYTIPLIDFKWVVSNTYTKESGRLLAQICEHVDNEYIAHTPIFSFGIHASLDNDGNITQEDIPPHMEDAFQNMIEIANKINNAFINGEFNGENAYEIAVRLGFKGTEQEWIESLRYDHSDEFSKLATQVNQNAQDAQTSAQKAEASEVNAKTSETKAKTSETNAKASEIATKESETNAKASETVANTKAQEASESAQTATEKATQATASADNAKVSETNAKSSETNAKTSETNASKSAEAAKASETAIGQVVANATEQADRAKTEADRAKTNADTVASSAQKITENTEQITQLKQDLTKLIIEDKASGNPCVISDSADWRLQEMNVYGQSEQFSTTGANLFSLGEFQITVGGSTSGYSVALQMFVIYLKHYLMEIIMFLIYLELQVH